MKTDRKSRIEPEFTAFTKYYEHDGMLRAYANRAMFLAMLFGVIAISSLGFAIYVRIQPPTIIRVDKDGEATVVGARSGLDPAFKLATVLSAEATAPNAPSDSAAPTDLEARAVLRRFLQHYLSYMPDSVTRSFAESLNMMTINLRRLTMDKLRDDDTIGKIQQDQIISDFRIRSIERSKDAPWTYVVFGVRDSQDQERVRDNRADRRPIQPTISRRTTHRAKPQRSAGGRLFRTADGGRTRQQSFAAKRVG